MSTLHITNGDCAATGLRAFIKDPVAITADVLHEGPAPAVEGKQWYDVRARYLSEGNDAAGYEDIRRRLEASDGAIADASRYDEVVLWFEHDLFDQLLLIRTLQRIARLKPRAPSTTSGHVVTLICIDRFPDVERFIGLGQLSAQQLATLVDTRRPVSADQFDLASRAWAAFRAPHPSVLAAFAADASGPLRFLGAALKRFLAEYPSAANGLSRTANSMLRILADGPLDGGTLFERTQAGEERPFIGDWTFFRLAAKLAAAHAPLVSIDGTPERDLRRHTITITNAGRQVLNGDRDAIALNGIDEWRGGVHLAGRESLWRWNEKRGTIVELS